MYFGNFQTQKHPKTSPLLTLLNRLSRAITLRTWGDRGVNVDSVIKTIRIGIVDSYGSFPNAQDGHSHDCEHSPRAYGLTIDS